MYERTTTNYSADEAAVRALCRELMDGWNRGSGEDFAAVFTEDGDLVAFDGTHFKGRGETAGCRGVAAVPHYMGQATGLWT